MTIKPKTIRDQVKDAFLKLGLRLTSKSITNEIDSSTFSFSVTAPSKPEEFDYLRLVSKSNGETFGEISEDDADWLLSSLPNSLRSMFSDYELIQIFFDTYQKQTNPVMVDYYYNLKGGSK